MEQRLIDANALIKAICSNCALFLDKTCDGKRISCYPISIVLEQPTIDAVPVVRCSKCRMSYIADKSMEPYGAEIGKRYCASGQKVTDDFFCADGKRKDGEND